MSKLGTDFELLVKAIYEEILSSNEYDTVKVEHDVKVLGKSGQLHQIDVYWELNIAGILHRVAVECKEYKNTISVGKIRDFYGALDDIGNISGIFVTTKGYQSGAITFAEHKDIALKVVEEPTEEEMDNHQEITTVDLKINIMCIKNVVMTPKLDVKWVIENTNFKEGDIFTFDGMSNEIKVLDLNYNNLGTILDFENKLPREPENTLGLNHSYEFDDAFIHVPDSGNPPLKLHSLSYNYDTYTVSSNREMNFKFMAEAIIKDVLTGESHLYNKQVV